jgi:hypothetical protein
MDKSIDIMSLPGSTTAIRRTARVATICGRTAIVLKKSFAGKLASLSSSVSASRHQDFFKEKKVKCKKVKKVKWSR